MFKNVLIELLHEILVFSLVQVYQKWNVMNELASLPCRLGANTMCITVFRLGHLPSTATATCK